MANRVWAEKADGNEQTKNRASLIVVADTSGLVAALDATHPAGEAARTALRTAGTLLVSPVLLGEFDRIAGRVLGRAAAHDAVEDIRRWARAGRVVLPAVTADIVDDRRDFRAITPLSARDAFRLLPDDA